jgi:hypothetical protein
MIKYEVKKEIRAENLSIMPLEFEGYNLCGETRH